MDDFEKLKEYKLHNAPVPSYEELQRLESDSLAKKEGVEIVAELTEENARLKRLNKDKIYTKNGVIISEIEYLRELLKECKKNIEWYKTNSEKRNLDTNTILSTINEVLK